MDDRELIGYCEIHCHTDRALFHVDHVKRMCALAGRAQPDLRGFQFVAVFADEMMPLVRDARRRMDYPPLRLIKGGAAHV